MRARASIGSRRPPIQSRRMILGTGAYNRYSAGINNSSSGCGCGSTDCGLTLCFRSARLAFPFRTILWPTAPASLACTNAAPRFGSSGKTAGKIPLSSDRQVVDCPQGTLTFRPSTRTSRRNCRDRHAQGLVRTTGAKRTPKNADGAAGSPNLYGRALTGNGRGRKDGRKDRRCCATSAVNRLPDRSVDCPLDSGERDGAKGQAMLRLRPLTSRGIGA